MNNVSTLNLPISIIRPLVLKGRFNLKVFWILASISIFALLIFYIIQVNGVVKEAYLIQNYEKKLNKLSQENENLIINFSKSNSLGNIEDLVKELGFEKVGKVHYIQVLESSVVTK